MFSFILSKHCRWGREGLREREGAAGGNHHIAGRGSYSKMFCGGQLSAKLLYKQRTHHTKRPRSLPSAEQKQPATNQCNPNNSHKTTHQTSQKHFVHPCSSPPRNPFCLYSSACLNQCWSSRLIATDFQPLSFCHFEEQWRWFGNRDCVTRPVISKFISETLEFSHFYQLHFVKAVNKSNNTENTVAKIRLFHSITITHNQGARFRWIKVDKTVTN